MHRTRLAAVLGGLLALGLAAAGSAAGIPDRLQNVENPSGPLIWISENELKRAIDDAAQDLPEGSRLQSVDHLLGHLEGGRLRWSLDWGEYQIAADGDVICEGEDWTAYMGEKATDLESLVKLSRAIVSVRVVDSEPGVAYGTAGELIEVEVLKVLKNPDAPVDPPAVARIDSAPPGGPPVPVDGFYLWDWYARMIIDGHALCLGTRQVPRGDFVLFLRNTWPDILSPLPIFGLDGSALVAADGSFYGTLLDRFRAAPQEEIARQLANLEQISAGKP